jgi:hypothetical protein
MSVFTVDPDPGCTWTSGVDDHAIEGHNIDELDNINELECKGACWAREDCKSIDWKPQEMKCSLNGVDRSEVPLKRYDGFVYYEKSCNEGKEYFSS